MTGKDGEKRTQTRRKLQFMVIALHLRGTRFSVDLNRGRFTLYLCSLNWPVNVSGLLYDLCLTSVIMKFIGEEEKRLLTADIMFCFLLTKQKRILNISNI